MAPALSDEPLTVTDGHFNLFVDHPNESGTKNMKYRMKLTAETGDPFYFYGYKVLRDDFGPDMWSDTTTLYISVWRGQDDTGELLGKGILKIRPEDLMKPARDYEGYQRRVRGRCTEGHGQVRCVFHTGAAQDVRSHLRWLNEETILSTGGNYVWRKSDLRLPRDNRPLLRRGTNLSAISSMSKALKSLQKGPCCSSTVPVSEPISSGLPSKPRWYSTS